MLVSPLASVHESSLTSSADVSSSIGMSTGAATGQATAPAASALVLSHSSRLSPLTLNSMLTPGGRPELMPSASLSTLIAPLWKARWIGR